MRAQRKRISFNFDNIDTTFLGIILVILLFGLFILYDSTVVYSQNISGEAYKFVLLQIGWYAIGLVFFWFFSKFDYRKIEVFAYPLFFVSMFFLLFLALIGLSRQIGIFGCDPSGFAPCINGATRWLYLNPPPLPSIPIIGILGFQPSELAKFASVIYLAVSLEKIYNKQSGIHSDEIKTEAFYFGLIVCSIVSAFVILQPNMSTAVLLFVIGMIMLYVSGVSVKPFLIMIPSLFFIGLTGILLSSYRRARLMTFLKGESTQNLGEGYQIKQILIALGSGGFFGLGIGQSIQKFQYIPEVASDSIFAIIGEELGFIGTVFLVLLFAALITRGFHIAENAADLRGKLLVTGVISWISLQFFINVAAMTHLIPLTGVPIPLISYGGSSVVFILMGLGVVASVSRTVK